MTIMEIIAHASEQEACAQYEWTPEQFEMWWTKDPRNRNREKRLREAAAAIEALTKHGYMISKRIA